MHNWPLHLYQVGESMMIVCSTYADLTALTALTGLVDGAVYGTGGRAAVGDGGYGHWRYQASATDTANGGTLLAIDGGGAGRFFRLDVGTYIDVRWFGLKLDGTTNSTQTWQNIITAAGTIPADIYIPFAKPYVDCPGNLDIKCMRAISNTEVWEEVHFANVCPIRIFSNAYPEIRLTSSANYVFRFTYNSSLGNYGPFWGGLVGVHVNGNGMVSSGAPAVWSDYNMHFTCKDSGVRGADVGVLVSGYGSALFDNCVVWAKTCIALGSTTGSSPDPGGDSTIRHCHFWPKAGGAAVDFRTYAGNTEMIGCTINRDRESGTLLGVRLSGDASGTNQHQRHIRITSCEFAGMDIAIYGVNNGSNFNSFACTITRCHVRASGTSPASPVEKMTLFELHGFCTCLIAENYYNTDGDVFVAAATHYGGLLYGCRDITICGSQVANYNGGVFYLNACVGVVIDSVKFRDVGLTSNGHLIVELDAASTYTTVSSCQVLQASTSYAQTFVYERTGGNFNKITDTLIQNLSTVATLVGANSATRAVP